MKQLMGHLFATVILAAAVIVDSGSTNAPGFRIVVKPSGKAELTSRNVTKRSQVPEVLAKRFYADLEALKPLSNIPARHCMKSASFGTTRTIQYGGQESPDLSCGGHGDARLEALIQDTNEIVSALAASGDNKRR